MCQWVKRLQHPSGTSAEDTYWIGTIRHCFTLFRFCVASSKSSANNVFLCTNKESKTMGVLDNDYIRIKEKPWLISLVCTIFVVYPNVAWLHCELTFLARNEVRDQTIRHFPLHIAKREERLSHAGGGISFCGSLQPCHGGALQWQILRPFRGTGRQTAIKNSCPLVGPPH